VVFSPHRATFYQPEPLNILIHKKGSDLLHQIWGLLMFFVHIKDAQHSKWKEKRNEIIYDDGVLPLALGSDEFAVGEDALDAAADQYDGGGGSEGASMVLSSFSG